MRQIKYIVIHCTAGRAQQKTSDIIAYWRLKLGWKSFGYHWIVGEDGTKERLTEDYAPTNGVKGFNANSIHLWYKGGWDGTDTRTDAQKRSLLELVQHYIKLYPNAKVVGHRDLSPDLNGDGKITSNEWVKLCPCFDASKEYANI
jgi:N-acetylmuramoyl-L-alanine amidase